LSLKGESLNKKYPRKIPTKEKERKKEAEKVRKHRHACHSYHHFLTKCRVREYITKEERRLGKKLTEAENRQLRYKELVPVVAHHAWNTLFAFKFPWEAIERIKNWSDKSLTHLQRMLLKNNQLEAWNVLFGKNASPRQAIEIVRIDWTPPYPPAEELSDEVAK